MGIARALRRVKRQAKRGGLGAPRTGLGEELRSGSIPVPLQGAARRIAALIDPASARRSSHKPGSTATPVVGRTPAENLRPAPPEHANKLGSDRGDAPAVDPQEPATDTAVDPIAVGATPVYDATPVEAAPVDATPNDVSVPDATPVVVADTSAPETSDAVEEAAPSADAAPSAEAAPSEDAAPTQPKPKKGDGAKKKPSAAPPAAKEKLAASEEEAKSAARSGPKGKHPKGRSGKTSKKK